MPHIGGGWEETPPHMIVKSTGVQQYTIKRYINASFIPSFIQL